MIMNGMPHIFLDPNNEYQIVNQNIIRSRFKYDNSVTPHGDQGRNY